MRFFGIAGYSGMGKTTLLERLIPELTGRGLKVSLIKHSHKNIEIDRPGKDSFRLREAGCSEVLLLGNERWALMHELRGAPEPDLDYLLDRLQVGGRGHNQSINQLHFKSRGSQQGLMGQGGG